MTGRPRTHGDDGPSPAAGRQGRIHGPAGSIAQAQEATAASLRAGRPGSSTSDGQTAGGAVEPARPVDPEEARVMDVYDRLGDEPPEFGIAANDAAYGGNGAHTEDRHGPDVPLRRDADPSSGNRTIEGRIYGDPPWGHTANWTYRWTDPGTMNRTVNNYVRDNWEGIRSDLALNGEHEGKIITGNAVGEGYFNPGMHGAGPRSSTYDVTSMAKVRIKVVPGSDPPIPFILTTFPSGT